MSATTVQRYLTTSRLPSRIFLGIAHFSTNRRLLAIGRAPQVIKVENGRKRDAKHNVPPRSPQSQEILAEIPKSLLVEAQMAGHLSISWREAEDILNEFDGFRLRSGSPKDLCMSENSGVYITFSFTNDD